MQFDEFKCLFESELEVARERAEKRLEIDLPRNYQIRFFGPGYPGGGLLDVQSTFEILYLYPEGDLFFRTIDIAVVEITDGTTIFFVRTSGHDPVKWENTWNDPPGKGPFRQLDVTNIIRPEN